LGVVPLSSLWLAWPSAVAAQSTFYVDASHPSAADSNPGSEALPWRSLGKAASTLVAGQTALVKNGNYAERLVPTQSGSAGAPIVFSAYPGHGPVIDGATLELPAYSGLVHIEDRSHLRIEGFRVRNAHTAPADPDRGTVVGIGVGGSNAIDIVGNIVDNTASSGIQVWQSSAVRILDNRISAAMTAGADSRNECITVGASQNIEVARNGVSNPDALRGEGIDVKQGSRAVEVHHNHVHHVPDVGIYVDAYDAATSDIQVHGNLVHEVAGSGIALASEAGGLLSGVQVTNNVVWGNRGVGIFLHDCCVASRPVQGVGIINNTLVANGSAGPGGWGGGIGIGNPDASDVLIRNNIAAGNLSFQIAIEAGSASVDHNLIDGFRGYPGETRGTGYREGAPGFANAAGRDYHLIPGALAIDGGATALAPAADRDGTPRPQGSAVDIGAYEFGARIFADGFEAAQAR
jgi:hypothetical protein